MKLNERYELYKKKCSVLEQRLSSAELKLKMQAAGLDKEIDELTAMVDELSSLHDEFIMVISELNEYKNKYREVVDAVHTFYDDIAVLRGENDDSV